MVIAGVQPRIALLRKVGFNLRPIYYFAAWVFAHYKLLYSCFNAPTPLAGPHYQMDHRSPDTYMEERSSSLAAWPSSCSCLVAPHIQFAIQRLVMENLPCLVFPWLFFWNGTKPHPLPWFTILCQADRNRGHPNQGSCCKHSKSMNTEIARTLTAPSGTRSSGSWNQSSSVLKRHSDWPSSVPGQQLQDCHLWLHHWHVLASCGLPPVPTTPSFRQNGSCPTIPHIVLVWRRRRNY